MTNVNSRPILGLKSCIEFNLINRNNLIKLDGLKSDKQKFIERNRDVFTGICRFPDKSSIELKLGTVPCNHPPRRVPISLRAKLKETLEAMEKRSVITKKDTPSEWSHNLVIVEKPNSTLP